jgi:hypothetical protein
MNSDYFTKLGEPNIKIAGLAIWIHNRESPIEENWLNVTIHCGAQGAAVTTNGSIIHLSEIARLLEAAEHLQKALTGKIEIECIEPYLSIKFEAEKLGHIDMIVDITPDHLLQQHSFIFEIDQSYLPKLISNCSTVLERYPIIGKR